MEDKEPNAGCVIVVIIIILFLLFFTRFGN